MARHGADVVSAEQAAFRGMALDWLTTTDDGLHWVVAHPQTGRQVQRSWYPAVNRCLDAGFDSAGVASGLHSYGAVPYAVGQGSSRWLVNSTDGQVWAGTSTRLTDTAHVYGDLSTGGDELFCVRESEAGDDLVVLTADEQGSTPTATVVLTGAGFLASPRLRSGRLAWVEWAAGVMPWDSAEVWCAPYAATGLTGRVRVAGGHGESAVQPQWGPDGRLYFMSDRTGWWNLYRWRDGVTVAVTAMDAECAVAPWESGYSTYALLPGGRIAVLVQEGPRQRLVVVDPEGGVAAVPLPYTHIKPYLAGFGDRVALIGSSATSSQQLAIVSTDGSGSVEILPPTTATAASTDASGGGPKGVSVPEVMTIGSGTATVTALYYPPSGGSADRPPPLIVRPHAGPTYNSQIRLDWQVQFFTSRGFAVADVDYRGSTGYGRVFRKALDGQWGVLDVQDCRAVALHLLSCGRALPGAVFISGASAGGFTALRAVCEEGPFVLAVARSAIVDPQVWATTAPRFQRPHAAILAHHGAGVRAPDVRRQVPLIHGDDDAVAPIADVAALAQALARRRMLIGLVRLPGIGHYLSGRAAVVSALEAELAAYRTAMSEEVT